MSPLPRTLIVGCGDLGTEIGIRMIAAGHDVIGWRRSVPEEAHGIAMRSVDVLERIDEPVGEIDSLVIALAPRYGSGDDYDRTYLDGVAHALAAVSRSGYAPRRALLVSSTAAYGAASGPVDEATVLEPADGRAATVRGFRLVPLTAVNWVRVDAADAAVV